MAEKNYAEVLIDGKIYTLAGNEEQAYLQKVASYISDKIAMLKATPGYGRQNKDYQEVLIYLNLADDYFKAEQQAELYKEQKEELDKEVYSLKHDLVSLQMKLDAEKEKNKKKRAKGASETKEQVEEPETEQEQDEDSEEPPDVEDSGDDERSDEDGEIADTSSVNEEESGTGETKDQSGQNVDSNVTVNVNSNHTSKSKKHKKGR